MTEYYYTSILTIASAAIEQGFEGGETLYDQCKDQEDDDRLQKMVASITVRLEKAITAELQRKAKAQAKLNTQE